MSDYYCQYYCQGCVNLSATPTGLTAQGLLTQEFLCKATNCVVTTNTQPPFCHGKIIGVTVTGDALTISGIRHKINAKPIPGYRYQAELKCCATCKHSDFDAYDPNSPHCNKHNMQSIDEVGICDDWEEAT